jgi:DNA-binding transcriptional regulator LsrR (DeoR family)
MPAYETVRQMNLILTLYYVEGLTQSDIAQRLGLSTAKVNRLLQQAREQGYVNISIRTPFQHLFELESRLKAVFGLQEVLVIPAVGESASSLMNDLGTVGASFLLDHLHDGDVIGIGAGSAVQAVVQTIEPSRAYQVEIAPVFGAIQGDMTLDVNYLATHLAARLGGTAYQLHAPAFVNTGDERNALLEMAPIKEILDVARRASMSLLGVGTVDAEVSRFAKFSALSPADMKHIAVDCGGVGEIAGTIYDREGKTVAPEYASRVIGLTRSELQAIPYRIGMAVTSAKALPLYGALRGGYLHALITDETAARGTLELFEKNFRNGS